MALAFLAMLHVADHEGERVGVAVLVAEVDFNSLHRRITRSNNAKLLILVWPRDQFAIDSLHVEVSILLRRVSVFPLLKT